MSAFLCFFHFKIRIVRCICQGVYLQSYPVLFMIFIRNEEHVSAIRMIFNISKIVFGIYNIHVIIFCVHSSGCRLTYRIYFVDKLEGVSLGCFCRSTSMMMMMIGATHSGGTCRCRGCSRSLQWKGLVHDSINKVYQMFM